MFKDYIDSPIGLIEIQANSKGVTQIHFAETKTKKMDSNDHLKKCKLQLKAYFDGTRKHFDIALDLQGTDFQKKVWAKLMDISFGESRSYQDIARDIGNSKSVRAVGTANGRNPIGIIIPCHRVIGKDKSLSGYAGGIHRKAWLLKHEGITYKENDSNQLSLNL